MPLMTQIRERMTTFFSVFAGLFVVYIVLDWGMDITGRRHANRQAEAQEIGKVNDVVISTRDFADLVKRNADNQKQQTGVDPDDNQMRLIRDQVWNEIVDDHLYDEQVKKFGITVPDKEISEWVYGDNPPEFLRKQFTDSTGNFDRVSYERVLKDPRNKARLLQVEDALRKQREREKLQSLILASVNVSQGDLLQRYVDQNIKYEGDYILFDPAVLIADSTVKVTTDDARNYYNEHSDDFKFEATRKLKFVQFQYAPSAKDSDEILSEVQDIQRRAKEGGDFLDLAKTYSETPVAETYYKHGELGQDRETAIFAAKAGDILQPVKEFDGYHLIKVLDFKSGKDEFVRASHILINIEQTDSASALKRAKELTAKAKGGADFAELARKNSTDAGSAVKGGDVGWFGKGRMTKSFEEAAFKAKPGQIVGPVRTPFGYHIIKVIAKDSREVKIADIHLPIRISSVTREELDQKARDLSYLAKETDLVKEAAELKYTVGETPAFMKGTNVPGVGVSATLNRFAFSSKVGTVSEAITLPNVIVVAMVWEAKDAGVRPLDEVRALIENRIKRERKTEKAHAMAEEMRGGVGPSDQIAKISIKSPLLRVTHAPEFTIEAGIPGFGRDMVLSGAISALNVGEISKPIDAVRGVFLIQLTKKTPFDSTAFAQQEATLRTQILSDKRNRFIADWSDQLKKSADIVDNRDTFYH